MSDYQKAYKAHYKKKNSVVTFPLNNALYEVLKEQADRFGITPNTLSKQVTTHFLNGSKPSFLTPQQHDMIREYMRISRGIATNINQMAHQANIGEQIDVNILIHSLKSYDDAFKTFIANFQDNDH